MREITIVYQLSEENEKRLQRLQNLYRQPGVHFTEDQLFEFIMLTGSAYDIDSKFKVHEGMLSRKR